MTKTQSSRCQAQPRPIVPLPKSAVEVTLGEPVVVSLAAPGEQTWGYWQFPTLSRMPGGELLLTVNNTQDDDLCYGHAGPAWLSHDDGRTWHAADLDEKALTISHSPIGQVHDGEFLCVPMPPGLRPQSLPAGTLGEPIGRFFSYVWRALYPLGRFPAAVQQHIVGLRGYRWRAATRQWEEEKVQWDAHGLLLRVDEGGMIGAAFSATSLEYRPVRLNNELLHLEYKMLYQRRDGSLPTTWEVNCVASTDNGRSWQRRGLASHDPSGRAGPTESGLCATAQGDLVCVARTTDQQQRPMLVSRSADGGRTWSAPRPLLDHGVQPTLELLENGVLILTLGRPGVQACFSPDGRGEDWTEPLELLPTGVPSRRRPWQWEELLNNPEAVRTVQKCGYTSMAPIGPETVLVAYCDVAHVDARGRLRKAVVVRSLTVRPRKRLRNSSRR